MRVGFFSPTYPSVTGDGGIGTYTRGLATSLTELGHQAHVITVGATSHLSEAEGVAIEVIGRKYVPVIERIAPGAVGSWLVGQKALHLTKSHKLDVFEFPNWEGVGAWFAMRRTAALVVRLSTSSADTREIDCAPVTWRSKCEVARERFQGRSADALVTHSVAHRRAMAAELGVDPATIEVIPLGIEVYPEFKRPQRIASHPTVVFLGRLEKRKGVIDLLKAIPAVSAQVPTARFVLIGPDRAHCPGGRTHKQFFLEEFPSALHGNVNFAGSLSNEEVTQHLQSADLFVAPSLYESFGLIFLEAMRWGVPVIGTFAGGIPEIIRHGESGVLVPPGDSTALGTAIISLLENSELRERLGAVGRRRVETYFSVRTMAERTVEFYARVVRKRRVDSHKDN